MTQRFPREELDRRMARLRERLAGAGIDLCLVHTPETICWLTGHETAGYYVYQCLLVPADGEPVLVLRETEGVNAEHYTYLRDIAGYPDTMDPIDATLRAVRGRPRRVALESRAWFLPPAMHARLRERLTGADVVEADDLLAELRLVKSPLELEAIREAGRIAGAAVAAGEQAAVPGMTERDVAAAVFATLVQEGSEYLGMEPFVASGPRSGTIHASWSERRIEEGDPVLIEVAACVRRYHATLMHTRRNEPPPDAVAPLFDACVAARDAALAEVRPGGTPEAVDRACRRAIDEAGLIHTFRKRTGYSIGIAFAPDWGEGHILSLRAGETRPLEPGMVLHVVPTLRIPGAGGAGFSATVAVTETGHEVLTAIGREALA